MAKQNINVGTAANDKKGDSLRAAFQKVNANFTELYTELGLANDVTLSLGAFEFAGSTISTTDSTAIVIDQSVTVSSDLTVGGDIVPQTALGGDLGSSTLPWRSLYVSQSTIYLGGVPLSLDANGNLTVNGSQVGGGVTSYADLTNKPTIPTSFDKLVNGANEVVLEADGKLKLPNPSYGEAIITSNYGTTLLSSDQAALHFYNGPTESDPTRVNEAWVFAKNTGVQIHMYNDLHSEGDYLGWSFKPDGNLQLPVDGDIVDSTGASVLDRLTNGNFDVVLGSDGALTLPGDIKSNGNINIDINLTDSTLRRWQFGEDGELTLPEGLQTTSSGTLNLFTDYGSGNINIGGNSPTITMGGGQVNIGYLNTRIVFGYSGVLTVGTSFTNFTGTPASNGMWTTAIATGTNGNGGPQNGVPVSFTVRGAFGVYSSVLQNFYNQGQNYAVGDTITIAGTQLGGTSPANDLTFTIAGEVGNTYPNLGPGSLVFDYGLGQFFGYIQNTAGTSPVWSRLDNTPASSLVNGAYTVSLGSQGLLSLGASVGGIHANQDTGIITIGDNIAPNGAPYAPSTVIQVGGATNAFLISAYGPPARSWSFGMDGALTIPGDIKSSGNINIDINLADSTLRRWQFGEDGNLNLAGPIILSNNGELRQSTTAYDAALAGWESIRGGEIAYKIANNIVTAEGWPMINWYPTGATAQGYIDFLATAFALQSTFGATLIIQPAMSRAFYDEMRAALIAIRDSYNTSTESVSLSSVYGQSWNFGMDGALTIPGDIRSEGDINIDINLADSTLRRWSFGEDGALTFPDGTNQSTAYTSVYAQSGATSAYATQRVLQYNPSTNAVTYSNTLDAVRAYITGYSSEIHVSPVAADDTGNGTIGDPVKTIARAKALVALAFETTGAGQRKTIILHPGDYVENVTIDNQYTVLTTHELVGKSTTLSGTLTITTGCTIDGLKMTNLVISATSATGSVDIIGCTVTTATTKTSTAYTNFRGCDLSSSTLSITGGGTTILSGGNYFTLAVNNAAAGVLAKAVISMGPVTLTAGTLQLSDTLIYSATNTSYAITQSAGSVITINNCQTLIPDLSNVSRISLNGFYSILSAVYDKPNSILVALSASGGSLSSIIYDQYINADRLILSSGGQITFPDATVQTTAWTGSVAAGTLTGTALASGVVSSSLTSVGTLGTLAVTGAVTAESFNTDQITVVGNRLSTTVTNANLEIECNGTGGVVINTVADATTASTVKSAGYLGLPQSATATTATLAIGDAGKHIYITSTGQTITIPAASSVAYPIGTTITFIAGSSATTTTIAISTDTLRLAGGTSTGSRTLAANGMATAVKVSGTSSAGVWYINGIGLT